MPGPRSKTHSGGLILPVFYWRHWISYFIKFNFKVNAFLKICYFVWFIKLSAKYMGIFIFLFIFFKWEQRRNLMWIFLFRFNKQTSILWIRVVDQIWKDVTKVSILFFTIWGEITNCESEIRNTNTWNHCAYLMNLNKYLRSMNVVICWYANEDRHRSLTY